MSRLNLDNFRNVLCKLQSEMTIRLFVIDISGDQHLNVILERPEVTSYFRVKTSHSIVPILYFAVSTSHLIVF